MCVIVFKPAGVAIPDYETFSLCWDTNPDGFGMCYADGQSVTIDKGYMDVVSAWLAMSKLNPAHAAILHFRISTSGLVDSGACHPYPITTKTAHLRALRLVNLPYALAHNGIVGKGGKVLNDTQLWIQHELAPYMGAPKEETHKFVDEWAEYASSRFAILYADTSYHLAGRWTQDDNGLFYSNTHWGWGRGKTAPRVSSFNYGQDYEWEDWANTYEEAVYDGYTPVCPVCGSDMTIAHMDSLLSLCECEDCQTVFNGQTGDVYTLDLAASVAYRELNALDTKKGKKNRNTNMRKAAYYGV